MTTTNESGSLDEMLAKIDAALDGLAPVAKPSHRQLIIARQSEIRRKVAQGHSMQSIRDEIARAGCDVPLSTFRDYVYNGRPSRENRAAKVSKSLKTRTSTHPDTSSMTAKTTGFTLPANATEATAGGMPVKAHKML